MVSRADALSNLPCPGKVESALRGNAADLGNQADQVIAAIASTLVVSPLEVCCMICSLLSPDENVSLASIAVMRVCRTCGKLSGEFFKNGSSVRQQCKCEKTDEDRWLGFDFNEIVTLCYGCGLAVLPSGSRYSLWFCEPCKQTVCALNDACNAYVIPTGRHSFMGSRWQRDLSLGSHQPDVQLFVSSLNEMFNHIDLVHEHMLETVRANCDLAKLEDKCPEICAYLSLLQREVLLRPRRVHELLERFRVPETIVSRIASDMSN